MASVLKVDKLDPQSGTALELGTSGDTISVPSGATLDISASTLTPPATMPASSGINLTALNATNLGSGTVPTARLGTGTASSSTILYGDQTYKAEPGGGGKILQVVTATTTTNANITTDTFTDTTLTADITPSATSSLIFVCCQQTNFNSGVLYMKPAMRLLRDSTQLFTTGYVSPSVLLGWWDTSGVSGTTNGGYIQNMQVMDSPSSTSALTYKTQMLNGNDTSGYCGTQNNMGDGVSAGFITLMEIDGS